MEYGLKVTKAELDIIIQSNLDWYPWDLNDESEIIFNTEEERSKAIKLIENIGREL